MKYRDLMSIINSIGCGSVVICQDCGEIVEDSYGYYCERCGSVLGVIKASRRSKEKDWEDGWIENIWDDNEDYD